MTLQSSGSMTFADIRAELGMAPGASLTIPSADIRDLIGVPSGSIVIPTDFYSKSLVTQTDIRTTAATSHSAVSFGATGTNRWIVVLAFHGDTGTNPRNTPTCTVGGVAATRITAASTGSGGTACGSAIFVAQPSGTSGTVAVTWGSLSTIIVVLRVVTYTLTSANSSDGASSPDASSSLSIDIPTNGLLVGCEIKNDTNTTTWTGLTKNGESTVFTSKSISYGWDYNMSLQAGRAVSWSPYSSSGGTSSGRAASFVKT